VRAAVTSTHCTQRLMLAFAPSATNFFTTMRSPSSWTGCMKPRSVCAVAMTCFSMSGGHGVSGATIFMPAKRSTVSSVTVGKSVLM
jgi:hypothetical protein